MTHKHNRKPLPEWQQVEIDLYLADKRNHLILGWAYRLSLALTVLFLGVSAIAQIAKWAGL